MVMNVFTPGDRHTHKNQITSNMQNYSPKQSNPDEVDILKSFRNRSLKFKHNSPNPKRHDSLMELMKPHINNKPTLPKVFINFS